MDKKKHKASHVLAHVRGWIQAVATILTNIHLPNFFKGEIYRGNAKRFVCGFLCPFGWIQDLLHKIPCKKLSTKKLKPLTYLKYVILLLTVVLLPVLVVNDVGMGDPFFCKYICPQVCLRVQFHCLLLIGYTLGFRK